MGRRDTHFRSSIGQDLPQLNMKPKSFNGASRIFGILFLFSRFPDETVKDNPLPRRKLWETLPVFHYSYTK